MSSFHDHRLGALRGEIRKRKAYGFVVPRTDRHQGEYISDHDQRLAWLSGFTGSAGVAVITLDEASLFVDGRYTLQATRQLGRHAYTIFNSASSSPYEWVKETFEENQVLLLDPWLHTEKEVTHWQDVMNSIQGSVEFVTPNLIDLIWQDQPAPPHEPLWVHPFEFHQTTLEEKLSGLYKTLDFHQADSVVLSAPDSIAWLLNIRGSDVIHTPVALAFAIVKKGQGVEFLMTKSRVTPSLQAHFKGTVTTYQPEELEERLKACAHETVLIDPRSTPYFIIQTLEHHKTKLVRGEDPCVLPKALKNPREQQGIKESHIRDGVAVTRLLAWIDEVWPGTPLSELKISNKLLEFRKEGDYFLEPSFNTIAAVGANAAIVHYAPTKLTDCPVANDVIFLLDSGGQYLDGTTDITRTFSIGNPSAEQKDRFTRVLKGHIAIARAIFPDGTTGAQLDILARMPLWQEGLDFDHGTGHGVGYCLSVHEGPQRISKVSHTPLMPGMVLSNEPGYYKNNEYGIRIESLILVKEHESFKDKKGRPMLCFETLTQCPIDINLMDANLLTFVEKEWLNSYHEKVFYALKPHLSNFEQEWLKKATLPLPF